MNEWKIDLKRGVKVSHAASGKIEEKGENNSRRSSLDIP